MANIVILGAGIGGINAAFEIKAALGTAHAVTVIGDGPKFSFTPSNPWVAVGMRSSAQVELDAAAALARRDIRFIPTAARRVRPELDRVELADGGEVDYDYLVISTGPRLAFDEIPGFGPDAGFTQSVCTTAHAEQAWQAYQQFLDQPGPIVIGAAQGASCFGPAYEFAMIVDADLRKRKLRDRVPMSFVTSEPYIGHMGLAGVGDTKGVLESELRQRHIKWITNARVKDVGASVMNIDELDAHGELAAQHVLPFAYAMLIPAFAGVDAVQGIDGLVNARGFVLVDKHQRNPTWTNIYAAGVCVAIAPVEATPVPTGAPKTGLMIESMVTAIATNLRDQVAGRQITAEPSLNALCLADFGDTGMAFLAMPQLPPRNTTWSRKGAWVRLAKIAFEKYFLHKVRSGNVGPFYEEGAMKLFGIERLKPGARRP